ncbi:MAG TPA: PqqD family peptide modification chaperone [Pirellulaceae bacterium]|nr:PqqD family peptide modification chaperone [Pirellulaceae bacterium]
MQKNVGVDADAAGRRPTPRAQNGEWQQTETLPQNWAGVGRRKATRKLLKRSGYGPKKSLKILYPVRSICFGGINLLMNQQPLQLTSLVVREQGVLASTLDEGVTMLGDNPDEFFQLDAVGKSIWELLDEPVSVLSLCGTLAQEFEVDPAACQRDVLAFLEQLREKGLIKVSGGA